ncbi:hypothetical protein HZB60_03815 [candidate division KSB1 bacterium]|nr:hypothetical protein [candidate division KSB1 bacterium]
MRNLMLTRFIPFIVVTLVCLLIAVGPVIGSMGHACDEGHETSSSTAEGDHDDSQCGCPCHIVVCAVLFDVHGAPALPTAPALYVHISSTFHTYLPSIERPPRLHS